MRRLFPPDGGIWESSEEGILSLGKAEWAGMREKAAFPTPNFLLPNKGENFCFSFCCLRNWKEMAIHHPSVPSRTPTAESNSSHSKPSAANNSAAL